MSSGKVLLPEHAASQVRRVLRMRQGEQVAVFDGSGAEWTATLQEVSDRRVAGVLGEERKPGVELPVEVTVCQSLVRPERFELVLQKCTELGAARFVPLITERVQAGDQALSAGARLERWRRIIQEAAEQSGRTKVPDISPASSLLDTIRAESARGPVVLLWEEDRSQGLRQALRRMSAGGLPAAVALIIGPVGGFAEQEVESAESAGAIVAGMGKRVLRSETAAIASLAALLYEFGLLGG
jgi:16S rRNA (uracil1498-N3)-methyltransferase